MPIPESQLKTWSNQGAVVTAKQTHESIRTALQQCAALNGKDFDVYLQGSYKNDTNIRGDSDVDVVVQLNSAFHSNLSEEQKRRFGFTAATYGWEQFRADVLRGSADYYGCDKVCEGRKSLKVQTRHLPADVVVCIQYRKYPSSPRSADDYVEGMTFYVRGERRCVINYPKLHYEKGVAKNEPSRTKGRYKPTVRLFKNARSYLVDHGSIPRDLAPSYFLECLLYNVPDEKFGPTFQDTFCNILNWLLQATNWRDFVCQNEQMPLFGNTPEQWSEVKAERFVRAMAELWSNWR